MIIAHFVMGDRNEYDIPVEKTEGMEQADFDQTARAKLTAAVVEKYGVAVQMLPKQALVVVTWQTINSEAGKPAIDKHDGITAVRSPLQKVRLDLLPTDVLVEVAKVFTFGAAQYGDHNWREGFSYSRCYGAALRHMMKWHLGEERDDESGITHLAHAIVNLMFLMEYQKSGAGRDDRMKVEPNELTQLFAKFNTNIPKGNN